MAGGGLQKLAIVVSTLILAGQPPPMTDIESSKVSFDPLRSRAFNIVTNEPVYTEGMTDQ